MTGTRRCSWTPAGTTRGTLSTRVTPIRPSTPLNLALTSIALPVLTTVGSSIFVGRSMRLDEPDALTSLSAPVLATVTGLYIVYNAALPSVSFPMLTWSGYFADLSNNSALTSISLPLLTTVVSSFVLDTDPALTSLSVPSLEAVGVPPVVGGDLIVRSTALTSLSFPALASVSQNFIVTDNATLPTCEAQDLVAQLTSFSGTTTITGNDDAGACL